MGLEPRQTTLVQKSSMEFGPPSQPSTGTTLGSSQWKASTRDLEASMGKDEKSRDRMWIGTSENEAEI